jgi:hypothetical protein
MTTFIHRLVFALPISPLNLEMAQRWGVAGCEEFTPLTNLQRLRIADRTTPLDQVLAIDVPGISTQSKNFQVVCALQSDPSTPAYYLGAALLKDIWWTRFEDRFRNAPIAGMRYARQGTVDGQTFLLTSDHNVPPLAPFVGQALTIKQMVTIAGLVRYVDPQEKARWQELYGPS